MVYDPASAQICSKLLGVVLYSPVAQQLIVEDNNPHVAAAMGNPLLGDETPHGAPFHRLKLIKSGLELPHITDFEDLMAFAAVVSLKNKWKGKRKTSLLWWKTFAVVVHVVKCKGLGMRNPNSAEEQDISDFSRMTEAVVVVRKNSLTVAPTEFVQILP